MFEHHDPFGDDASTDGADAAGDVVHASMDNPVDDPASDSVGGLDVWSNGHFDGTDPAVSGDPDDSGLPTPAAGPDADSVPTNGEPDQGAAPSIELTTPSGEQVDVGVPDQDLDGDGIAESVAVRTDDGHLLIVSDPDADGTADQLIDVNPDTGHVSWLAVGDDGQWTVQHHGHVSADGALVIDIGPGSLDHSAGEHNAGEHSGGGSDDGDPGAVGAGHEGPRNAAEEQVTVSVDGRIFPAGPATIDSDHDGVDDTVAVPGVGGSTQYYQDTDGDGIADRAWTVNADGTRIAEYTIAAGGEWVQAKADPGPLDSSSAPNRPLPPWGRDHR